ncbi:NADPH-dependent curcumin reductase [Andreprevotia sp. IGB-42]|uniref:NADP-dependent oxidoreductase n=1 Tax=Andreprevotia sp. IGB-42 TaxID=2497473 RepID=UPI00135CCF93|nr:NADP-dependent oxidoreductase [Andreprevotia sp. IGB-42]KAF0812563.1 NADPH-dependent curcumin reductase [Andreprevotia sp. IGB-42]
MPQTSTGNRRIVLATRPRGAPAAGDFRLEEAAVPRPGDGEVLLRTLYLSLDPYMRNLMEAAGTSYAPAIALDQVMVGSTVSRVVESRHAGLQVGELVLAQSGWQDYAVANGADLKPLGDIARPSQALGGLGMPGFTAYVGLLHIGQLKAGETVVVAAATGAVGAVVGQLARLKGARVVGVAGGADKCRYAVEELGFDACLDRNQPDLGTALAAACPDGIDVYFENVGGAVFEAVLPLLNLHARVPVCGIIAHYNDGYVQAGPNLLPQMVRTLLQKRIRMEGFIILDHFANAERVEAFNQEVSTWVREGQIKLPEDIVPGLENAPDAFTGLLAGRNFGKLVIQVAED